MNHQTIKSLICEHLKWMEVVGKSIACIHTQKYNLNSLARKCGGENATIESVTVEAVVDFVNNPEHKLNTRMFNLNSARLFCRWLVASGKTTKDVSFGIKIKRKGMTFEQRNPARREPFTEDEYKKLIAFLDKAKQTGTIRAWKAISMIGWQTGLRLGDIISLERDAINRGDSTMKIFQEKTGAWVTVKVDRQALDALDAVGGRTKRIFPDYYKNINKSGIGYACEIFWRLLKQAGIHGKSFHCFRHSRATNVFTKTGSVEMTAHALGHKAPESALSYIHLRSGAVEGLDSHLSENNPGIAAYQADRAELEVRIPQVRNV